MTEDTKIAGTIEKEFIQDITQPPASASVGGRKKENKEIHKNKEKTTPKQSNGRLAVILVRGLVGVTKGIKDTLAMLNLSRKNHCVIIDNNPIKTGMLQKVKDYITWGEISDEVFMELVDKRGEEWKGREQDRKGKYHYKIFEVNGKKYKRYFRLNPPRKGFGRKGIKVSFKASGALGYRGGKINDLIRRMI